MGSHHTVLSVLHASLNVLAVSSMLCRASTQVEILSRTHTDTPKAHDTPETYPMLQNLNMHIAIDV